MSYLSIDFETRSTVDLRKAGVYRYAEDPTTDIWCMAYAFPGGEKSPRLWWPGSPEDAAIEEVHGWVTDGKPIRAWNAQFERLIWREILGPRYGFPTPSNDQYFCTAADAAALGLPRSLGKAAKALGLPVDEQKDAEGRKLMMKMAKPRRVGGWVGVYACGCEHGPYPTKTNVKKSCPAHNAAREDMYDDETTVFWWGTEERLHGLYEYCKQDVVAETAIAQRIRPLGNRERQVYLLDQAANDRGVHLDLELVHAARAIVAEGEDRNNAELRELTEGKVETVRKVADMTRWLQAEGVAIDNLRKDTIRDWLAEDDGLREDVSRVMQLRANTAKSSTAKLEAMLNCVCSDGRARGLFLYHGAATGRWSGKLIQPQNFPRGDVKNVESFIPDVMARDYDTIDFEHPPLIVIASLLRSMLTAAPGHELIAADFSQIEARVLAWIAGQDNLVQLFRDGGRVYEETAAFIFNKPVDEIENPSFERTVGKNTVLGCFGADTLVLTDRGPVRIAEVTPQDRVWDGVEWTEHGGVIYQGEKEVIDLWGVNVTPDHGILTWNGWTAADALARRGRTRFLALVAALVKSLFSVTFRRDPEAGLKGWWWNVRAVVAPMFTSVRELWGGVIAAHVRRLTTLARTIGDMLISYQTTHTAPVCSTGLAPSTGGVTTPGTPHTYTTVDGVLLAPGPRRPKDAVSSSNTWSRLKDGIAQIWNWIGSTWTGGTNRTTSGSRPDGKMPRTDDPSPTLRPVYDILNSGSRNRFTVLTAKGPLIVHNCGFQMGADRYAGQVKEQTGIELDRGEKRIICRSCSASDNIAGPEKGHPKCCDKPDWHVDKWVRDDVAWKAVNGYRTLYARIKQFWRDIEDAATNAVRNKGTVYTVGLRDSIKYVFRGQFLWCILPSGRPLAYGKPQIKLCEVPWEDEETGKPAKRPGLTALGVDSFTRRWKRRRLYGGLLTENVVQAMARDLMAAAWIRADKAGYPVILTVHDELVTEPALGEGDLDEFLELMTTLPKWAKGLPVAAEGWRGERYRK